MHEFEHLSTTIMQIFLTEIFFFIYSTHVVILAEISIKFQTRLRRADNLISRLRFLFNSVKNRFFSEKDISPFWLATDIPILDFGW